MSARLSDSPAQWLAAEVDRIRGRRDLSNEGRAAHIGRAYKRAKAARAEAVAATMESWSSQRRRLRRDLFAPPRGREAEWRALVDGVRLTTPAEATEKIDAAVETGDDLAARAWALAALDQAMGRGPQAEAWAEVTNGYGQSEGAFDAALTALSEHEGCKPRPDMGEHVWKPSELNADPHWEQRLELADSPDYADLTDQAAGAARLSDEHQRVMSRGQSILAGGSRWTGPGGSAHDQPTG